jgi:hypothetical protein
MRSGDLFPNVSGTGHETQRNKVATVWQEIIKPIRRISFCGVGNRIADRKAESRNDINYVKCNVSAHIPTGHVAE